MPNRSAVMIAFLLICSLGLAAPLKLIPQPQQVALLEGSCDLSAGCNVALASAGDADEFAAQQLEDELKLSLGVGVTGKGPAVLIGGLGAELIQERLDGVDLRALEGKGPEAYVLVVRPAEVVAAGSGPAGTFYAVQTLKQFIRANAEGKRIPCAQVLDWPGLQYRGYSDDISRGPIPTMDFFKRQIRTMAEFKMNTLTFYTEHVFKLDKHPVIAPPDGITADEVRELTAYARQYHVELVGNFQSFGHFWNILRHQEYAHLRETGGIITPAKEESYQFLDDVYSEICPAYESRLFNVNCDETQGLGEGPSKELAAKIGVGRVYLGHMNRIHDMLRDKYGKRMMMWGDIALEHPEMIPDLAQDTILLSWGYGAAANYDRAIKPFVDAGLEFMVCPGVSCWSMIFPNYENATVNIRNYVRDGAKFGAIGMLNTTWDDDGENLFHWNFYGTNWGAACAWRPADADLEAFDAAYAQISYGAPDDKVTRAIKLLSSCKDNPITQGNRNPAFWVRPFGALATTYDAVMTQAEDLMSRTTEALQLLDAAREEAAVDAEDLDYLAFAAKRLQYMARARELQLGMSREYTEAVAQYPDKKPAQAALRRAWLSANELADTVADLEAEYRRLWLAENRPWWLEPMAGKYSGLINDLRANSDRLRAALDTLETTGTVPDPAAIGLALVETSRRSTVAVPAQGPILPQNAGWWDARWPLRIPLRVEVGKTPRTDYVIEVRVNFGGRKVDPASVRAVEHAVGMVTPLLTQYQPLDDQSGLVTFAMPGRSEPGTSRSFAVYYDVAGSAAKPAQEAVGLTTRQEGSWYWIENERYKALVGAEGMHIFEWFVKALGNLEITQPGRGGWSGFADSGHDSRDAWFQMNVETSGPVMTRLHGVAAGAGAERTMTFYAGKPYVEVMLARPVGFYWNYDNVDNFAKDKGNPGTVVFSNGHSEPVCASDEQIHGVAHGVTWSAKTRPDGLTLANITPEVKATHMTGPGGGWGGTGIEASEPVAHFIVYADKIEGDLKAILDDVQSTTDMRDQPRMFVDGSQARPQ